MTTGGNTVNNVNNSLFLILDVLHIALPLISGDVADVLPGKIL